MSLMGHRKIWSRADLEWALLHHGAKDHAAWSDFVDAVSEKPLSPEELQACWIWFATGWNCGYLVKWVDQTKTLRCALEAALTTWCPHDPGSDGADGETYHLCRKALGK